MDANDNLIVGTDPSGLILRITPAGAGICAVSGAEARDYGGGGRAGWHASTRRASETSKRLALPALRLQLPRPRRQRQPRERHADRGAAAARLLRRRWARPPAITGGSEIYRIQTDGYPRKIWSHAQDLVYALAFDAQGQL